MNVLQVPQYGLKNATRRFANWSPVPRLPACPTLAGGKRGSAVLTHTGVRGRVEKSLHVTGDRVNPLYFSRFITI